MPPTVVGKVGKKIAFSRSNYTKHRKRSQTRGAADTQILEIGPPRLYAAEGLLFLGFFCVCLRLYLYRLRRFLGNDSGLLP